MNVTRPAGAAGPRQLPTPLPPPAGRGRLVAAGFAIMLISGTVGYVAGRSAEPPERLRAGPSADLEAERSHPSAATPYASRYTSSYTSSYTSPAASSYAYQSPFLAPIPPSVVAPLDAPNPFMVTAQAATDLERTRPQLVDRCWRALPKAPAVESATVMLEITFDAQGREVGRSVQQERGGDDAAMAGVLECLRGVADLPLSVQPVGTSTGVQIPLTLP
jgi:hypothetical protein